MTKNNILSVLKFYFVDSAVHIFDDLLKQTPIMWIFIGWGWFSILAMLASLVGQIVQLLTGA